MFGLSLAKILLLAAVIAMVWIGYRWLARARKISAEAEQPRLAVEPTVKCPICGVFVAPRSARGCGRTGCPYGGNR